RELGIDTNEDYEITLSQLLSGARDYLVVDERMRDVLRAELGTTNPDPAAFKQFASATVTLSPAALRGLAIGPDEDASPRTSMPAMNVTADRPTQTSEPAAAPRKSTPTSQAPPVVVPSATPSSQPTITLRSVVAQVGERCRSCDE